MNGSGYPGTITKHEYSETGYGDYPLYHYRFTPAHYTKTFYLQACIHGNEHDGPQTLYRIMDIICNHANESAYSRLAQLRDNVRFIVVPCVSPWGFDNHSGNVPYVDWNGQTKSGTSSMNMNRNFDFVHQFSTGSAGNGGNYPFQRSEVRHVEHIIDTIGPENIDYCVDYHDGESKFIHFWINYNADGANGAMVRQLVSDLIDEEERLRLATGRDYRDLADAHNDGTPDKKGYVYKDYVCDSAGYSSGITAGWVNTTKGMLGSVCEYLGGYFGYGFGPEQMTRSLRIRANLLIYAYEMIHTKGWLVNEAVDAEYFHFDYPISMTMQGLRRDASDMTNSHTIVSFDEVYARWDDLATKYPSYVTKSAKLGENSSGGSVYSYTLGNGSKKVLFIGGSMRWLAAHKETEFGMFVVAQYLCNDYIVNQSKFLKRLKQDYTIVVIPCIDINAGGNSSSGRPVGLNAAGLANNAKWKDVNDTCVPTDYALNTAADVPIFLSWLSANQDAIVLVSGGEDTSVYGGERPDYTTDYMTQFVVPRKQTIPSWLTGYCTHLEDDRGEDEPSVVQTQSVLDTGTGIKVGLTCGDYAFETYGIETYFINLKVSQKWTERLEYMKSSDSSSDYMYRTYETGRRIANIVNVFLMAGGDIA